MSDNKFILQLKGTQTPKSVVEIKNDKLVAPFMGVPHSTDVVGSIIDDKDSSVVVAKGAQNWKLDGSSLVVASSLSGDGADYTGEFNVSGSGLWINATYSLAATIFSAGTKWALKLCGKNLLTTSGQTIGFTLVVKIGNAHITSKTFTVAEGANVFCRQLVIDFSESEQAVIKAQSGDSLTVQLLCSDTNASATIYNGMTVFTALQRRVDGDAVASDEKTFDDVVQDIDDINDDIDQIQEDIEDIQSDIENIDNKIIIRSATIPTASASLVGRVYQYAGTTNGQYTHNYIYECVAMGTTSYAWVRVDVQPDRITQIQALQADITDIQALIPAQATPQNQLGDKNFINSSIATNTANFIGTFNSVAELEAYTGTVTNNDYAFVVGTDSAGNTTYNRYKYNGNTQQWVYEYTLNNSSFTAAQWASINSGVTTSDVLKARSAVQPSDLGNGTITITQGGEPKGSFTTNQATPTTIELDQGGSGSGHNVGDTFLTTRTDNELNGAVECNGATYNTTDFTGSQSIGQLLSAGKVPYVSLATYATLLSTEGYCDRFGWDGTGTTAFRVPTLDLHHAVIEVLEPTSTDPYWYRRYADGWVEQGGIYVAPANAANILVPFPISMADTNYTLTTTYTQPTTWESNTGNTAMNVTCRLAASTNRKLTNGFYFNSVGVDGVYSWRVSGKASVGSETLYQRAMVQLAVSATDEALETCTGVLANVAANTAAIAGADYVIESQLPTAANNYTWYRKYKSGWVEQGGIVPPNSGTSGTVILPVVMSDTNYTVLSNNGNSAANNFFAVNTTNSMMTTEIHWLKSASKMGGSWEVKGMYAQ